MKPIEVRIAIQRIAHNLAVYEMATIPAQPQSKSRVVSAIDEGNTASNDRPYCPNAERMKGFWGR